MTFALVVHSKKQRHSLQRDVIDSIFIFIFSFIFTKITIQCSFSLFFIFLKFVEIFSVYDCYLQFNAYLWAYKFFIFCMFVLKLYLSEWLV